VNFGSGNFPKLMIKSEFDGVERAKAVRFAGSQFYLFHSDPEWHGPECSVQPAAATQEGCAFMSNASQLRPSKTLGVPPGLLEYSSAATEYLLGHSWTPAGPLAFCGFLSIMEPSDPQF
jgi:hypothetical protein